VAFHRAVVGQLWTKWCLCGVLQELMSRELEDEKVSNGSREKNWFSTGVFPAVVFLSRA
jgi:hypothetical protein